MILVQFIHGFFFIAEIQNNPLVRSVTWTLDKHGIEIDGEVVGIKVIVSYTML